VASAISQLSVVAHSKPGFGLIGAVLSLTESSPRPVLRVFPWHSNPAKIGDMWRLYSSQNRAWMGSGPRCGGRAAGVV